MGRKNTFVAAARQFFRILFVLVLAAVGWTLYVQWEIHNVEGSSPPDTSDVGIVLGAALWDGVPSPALKERLDRAYELYEDGRFSYVIVSGGYDYIGAPLTEAEGMSAYLQGRGLPAERIVLENEATSTYENLKFSQTIMEQYGWEHAVIVTHSYHGARAMDIARYLGYADPKAAVTESAVMNMTWHNSRE